MLDKLRTALSDRYAIEREIGSGGMATVYLAHDLRHDRNVALKILKPELGAVLGPERFLSEIRVTAKLQHANLLPLFDSGECEGQLYYVMPFVEGESLRSLMQRERQLPVREAVRLAVAVAHALDYAHRHGVIHRDLKPENILLQEGQPFIADFGIALAVSNAGGERVTQTGLSLGTPQYMSPEQATGERVVDGRTDIYSLGAVLYEMLSGEPPHHGATVQAIIARVLTETPQRVRIARPSVPEHVDAAIAKALEKIPADRFPTAREFAEVLEGQKSLASVTSGARPAAAAVVSHQAIAGTSPVPWLVAAGATIAAVAALAFAARQSRIADQARNAEPVSFTISSSANEDITASYAAISPDGRVIVYVGSLSGSPRLFQRDLGQITARPLSGTEGATNPFFSPDGKWIGFHAAGELRRVQVGGGAVFPITKAFTARGARWVKDDMILLETRAITGQRSGLSQIAIPGGAVIPLMPSDSARGENLTYPLLLDDGKTLLIRSEGPGGIEDDHLAIASLGKPGHTVLDFLIGNPIAFVDGHVITGRWDGMRTTLLAVPVDLESRRISGDPMTLLDGAVTTQLGAVLSTSGTLVYAAGEAQSELVRQQRGGGLDTVLADLRGYMVPRISPNGRAIVFWIPGGTNGDVWLLDVAAKTLTRLATRAISPEWSPDGKHVVFIRPSTAEAGIWVQPLGGVAAPARQLRPKMPAGAGIPLSAVFGPDQRTVFFVAYTGRRRRDIYTFTERAGDTVRAWQATDFDEHSPVVSPDGKWVAYASDESGRGEVSVRSIDGGSSRVQISSGGGSEPRWSRDGTRLYYRNGAELIEADLATQATVSVRARRTLMTLSSAQVAWEAGYDVAPDGSVIFPRAAGGGTNLVVATNWLTDVKRKLKAASSR